MAINRHQAANELIKAGDSVREVAAAGKMISQAEVDRLAQANRIYDKASGKTK